MSDSEACPRCGSINWAVTLDGHDECVTCGYVDTAAGGQS